MGKTEESTTRTLAVGYNSVSLIWHLAYFCVLTQTVNLQIRVHYSALAERQHGARSRGVVFSRHGTRNKRVPFRIGVDRGARGDLSAKGVRERRGLSDLACELEAFADHDGIWRDRVS